MSSDARDQVCLQDGGGCGLSLLGLLPHAERVTVCFEMVSTHWAEGSTQRNLDCWLSESLVCLHNSPDPMPSGSLEIQRLTWHI